MSSTDTDAMDQQMRKLFASVAPQVADRGFTDDAMRRIARVVWIRRIASIALVAVAIPVAITVLAALLLPAEVLSSMGGVSWDASIAAGLCLVLLLRVTRAVRA